MPFAGIVVQIKKTGRMPVDVVVLVPSLPRHDAGHAHGLVRLGEHHAVRIRHGGVRHETFAVVGQPVLDAREVAEGGQEIDQ